MMDPMQLRYFAHLCETLNMTKTAESLHVAQSAISQAVARLEEQLGVQLFDRRGKRIALNEYGETYRRYAVQALNSLADGERALQDMRQISRGHVRLGVFAGSIMLPELLKGFRERYPDISFALIQHFSDASYDLSISYAPNDIVPKNAEVLLREEIYLAVPTNHRLAGHKEIVLNEVADEGFISLTKGKDLRKVTDAVCERVGFRPKIIFESDDPASVRGLISAGLGVAFFPSVSWYALTGESFVRVRIARPKFRRTLVLTWDDTRYMTSAMAALKEYIAMFFRELAERAR